MKRSRGPSVRTAAVLNALVADPTAWRYGNDLGSDLGLKSGSLYPILVRLADHGLLDAAWEPAGAGRPPRHLYRLSTAGLQEAARLADNRVIRRPVRPTPSLGSA